MSAIPNAGGWPRVQSKVRFEVDGRIVEVTVDWPAIRRQAVRTLGNKTRTSRAGPVWIREVRP